MRCLLFPPPTARLFSPRFCRAPGLLRKACGEDFCAPPVRTSRTGRVPRPWAGRGTLACRPRFCHGSVRFLSCSARPAVRTPPHAVCFTPGKAVLREGFFCGDATSQKNASTRGAAKPRHTSRRFLPRFYTASRLLRKACGEDFCPPAGGKLCTVKAVLREGFFCGDVTPQKNASTRGAAKPRHTAAFLWLLYHTSGSLSLPSRRSGAENCRMSFPAGRKGARPWFYLSPPGAYTWTNEMGRRCH